MKAVSLISAASLLSAPLVDAANSMFVMYTDGDDNVVERADPIVNPGGISAHVHQIFGANGFAPDMTYESLQQSSCTNVGSAIGAVGNAQDHSVYWHPALYAEALDGSGYIRVPIASHKLYYKDIGSGQKAEPFEFPAGFRMLAGKPTARAFDAALHGNGAFVWKCNKGGSFTYGSNGIWPTGFGDCPSFPGLMTEIHFPHCWDGQNLGDSNDATSHVAYPIGNPEGGSCPPSHPVRLPHILMENMFDWHSVVGKVKPDSFILSNGDNTGFGYHADFFNGWEKGAIPDLFDTCPQGPWGNHDIWDCGSLKKGSSRQSCKLNGHFTESVNSPGSSLPGCNPISENNPAAKYAVAPLGSNSCSQSSSGGDAPAAQPPTNNNPVSNVPSNNNPTYTKPTEDKPVAQPNAPSSGDDKKDYITTLQSIAKPAETPSVTSADGAAVVTRTHVEWVTDIVTAYNDKRDVHRHAHVHAHAKRAHHAH